jgi:hypothetical protein
MVNAVRYDKLLISNDLSRKDAYYPINRGNTHLHLISALESTSISLTNAVSQ